MIFFFNCGINSKIKVFIGIDEDEPMTIKVTNKSQKQVLVVPTVYFSLKEMQLLMISFHFTVTESHRPAWRIGRSVINYFATIGARGLRQMPSLRH